eukprot:Gb_08240 [translate_table: standard]
MSPPAIPIASYSRIVPRDSNARSPRPSCFRNGYGYFSQLYPAIAQFSNAKNSKAFGILEKQWYLLSRNVSESTENQSQIRWNLSGGKKPLLVWIMAALLCFGNSPQFAAWFHLPMDNAAGLGTAQAAGLFQMPPVNLNNRYYLVRAGESEFEKKGIINTNPVAKTSMDSGLSDEGMKQTVKAALELQAIGACEGNCWIWPSITQRAYQAAEIIASVNNIGRSRIVPEYSFLDARGLGAYEGRGLKFINEVYATDLLSPNLKPPSFTDGTPNESVADVFVRVTQLMSILETQYSSENVIIISPDSDNLTILQAGLTGLDLRRHSDLSFSPGEVRLVDITGIPARKPASGVFKCSNPPNCT